MNQLTKRANKLEAICTASSAECLAAVTLESDQDQAKRLILLSAYYGRTVQQEYDYENP